MFDKEPLHCVDCSKQIEFGIPNMRAFWEGGPRRYQAWQTATQIEDVEEHQAEEDHGH